MSAGPAKRRRVAGFSLLEVLVALLVLSFGVLSALGLQAISKRSTQNASQRTLAVHLAEDFFERLRNNFTLGGLAIYSAKTLDHEMGGGSFGDEPLQSCTPSEPCSPGQLALHDLWAWERTLDGAGQTIVDIDGEPLAVGGLVDPTACLFTPVAGLDGEYTLVIVWRSSEPGINPVFADAQIDGCGNADERYGPNNQYRQVAAVSTYIAR